MNRKRRIFWGKTAAILGAVPLLIWAHEYGPDAGYTNVPGELGTCAQGSCHLGTATIATTQISVAFPNGQTYVPGVKQHLTITISDPTQRAWGFQMTARNSGAAKSQAGAFGSSDANTLVMCASSNLTTQLEVDFSATKAQTCPGNMPLQYIEHSLTGYTATKGTGSGTYQFDWNPPATDVGSVVLYVAANAANGDLQPTGDHIYTKTYTLAPSTGGGGGAPTINEVDNAFSNIANSPIQSGTWVAIKGTNLSTSAGRGWNANENFPTSMDGTSVTINGKTAFVYFISAGQVNVQAPSDTALGPVNVVVNNNGQTATATATYQTNSPALLQWGGGQFPYALITNGANYVGNPAVVQGTVSAHAGDALTLWVTGLGTTNPAIPAGQQPTTFPPPTIAPVVTASGINIPVIGAVLRFAGLYQVNIQLPLSLPKGDLPIKIIQGSFQSPDGILINIQ